MVLRQILFATVLELVQSIVQGIATRSDHLVEQTCGCVLMVNHDRALSQNRTVVHLFVQAENGHASFLEAIGNGTLHRSGTAVLREQTAVNVHGTKLRDAQNVLGQDGIRHDDIEVGIVLAEVSFEFRRFQVRRLQDRQIVLERSFFHRRRRKHAATACRAIGLCDNS